MSEQIARITPSERGAWDKALIEAVGSIRAQLNWRGPKGRMGHIVISRENAEVLYQWIASSGPDKVILFRDVPVSVQHEHYDYIAAEARASESGFGLVLAGTDYTLLTYRVGKFILVYPEHDDELPGERSLP